MDQGGDTDGGKLTSLPPLQSLEEPAAWLVGARACLRPGGSVWSGSTQKSELHSERCTPIVSPQPTAYNKSPVAHPP